MNDNETLNIKIAADTEDDRQIFMETLREIKVKTIITFVNDGYQLINHLNTPGLRLPDVVILDLNMTLSDGVDCLHQIRKNSQLKDLVIVLYTTEVSEEKAEEAFVRGANIYIQKSNDLLTMKARLAQVINLNLQYLTLGLKKENFLLKV